jgi:hypothetical protein
MSDLQAIQRNMTAAILSGDMSRVAHYFTAGEARADRRLNIFRNNTLRSLTAALKAVSPVTVELVDEQFFDYAAHTFISKQPPHEARLSVYGSTFPRFLAQFEACRGFPIIPEMASLEWAIAEAQNAAELRAATMSAIRNTEQDPSQSTVRLQPNLRFTISHWPLVNVWVDHKNSAGGTPRNLHRRVTRTAIHRHGTDVNFVPLEEARFAFWRSLARRHSIFVAAERALARDPLFDLVRETVVLFRAGLVTSIETNDMQQEFNNE